MVLEEEQTRFAKTAGSAARVVLFLIKRVSGYEMFLKA